MPSVATDTDAFPSTVQRPNNGENADAASLSQGFNPLTQRTRYCYNRSIDRNYDVHRAPFNAVGSGLVNDRTAIAAAIAAAEADGGGTVWLRAGKTYRLDAILELPANVNLRATKGKSASKTTLVRNHIFPLLTVYNDSVDPVVIEGITFTDAVASSTMVVVSTGSADLVRCSLLGAAGITDSSQPLFLMSSDAGSGCNLKHCVLAPVNAQNAIKIEAGAVVIGERTVLKVPATYAGIMVNIASNSSTVPALLSIGGGTDFDATAHTSGLVYFVQCAGDYWSVAADNCLFRGGAVSSTAFSWSAGGERRLNVGDGITWDTITTRYNPAGDPLTNDSRLALIQHRDNVDASSLAVPTGVETFRARFTGGVASTLELPPILFRGQPLHIAIYNPSGSWGFSLTGPTAVKETQNTLTPGQTATAQFRAVDLDGSGPVWLQIGKWGYAS